MKIPRIAALLTLACLAPAAAAQSPEAASLAQRLITSCGLSVQLPGFAGQMKAQMEELRSQVDAAIVPALADAALEAFRPDVLEADILGDIQQRLTIDDMNAALAFLDTPAGRRVTRAEEQASTRTPAELEEYVRELKQKSPRDVRLSLVQELIAASYIEDITVRGMQAIALGVALGMDSTQPRERRIGQANIERHVKRALPEEEIKQELRLSLPVGYLYTYRNIDEGDLRAYLRFLTSASGKRYTQQMTEAFMGALVRASVRLGKLVDQRNLKRPA
jgi:Uncharacterized protein conserved in bacteria (DUF2059)